MRKKDERGAALVLVLGMIMLITIFGTMLAAQMTNTQLQMKKSEKLIDARNMAKMGLDYAAIRVEKAYDEYQDSTRKIVGEGSNPNEIENDKKAKYETAYQAFKGDVEDGVGSDGPIKGQSAPMDGRSYEIIGVKVQPTDGIQGYKMVKGITIEAKGNVPGESVTDKTEIEIDQVD